MRTEQNDNLYGIDVEPDKGVSMGDAPNLWPETNPSPYMDAHTPSEKFVPTPTMHSEDDSKGKKIIKYILIGVVAAFLIYVFVTIWNELPQTLFRGETGKGHFFG